MVMVKKTKRFNGQQQFFSRETWNVKEFAAGENEYNFFLVLYGAITFDPACSPEPYKQITIKGRFSNYTQEDGFDIAWAL